MDNRVEAGKWQGRRQVRVWKLFSELACQLKQAEF